MILPEEIIERLCRLPEDLRAVESSSTLVLLSMASLVAKSGYLQAPAVLTRERVAWLLHQHVYLVDDWLMWSGDQRWPSAWCFDEKVGNYGTHFEVYFYPGGAKTKFDDRTTACAEYIVRVVPWLIENHAPWKPKTS